VSYNDVTWTKISKEAKAFVRKCLTRDAIVRGSAEELLQHDWIKNNIDNTKIATEVLLNVNITLQSFRRTTAFQ
jgi:serine/threonine protein kinase